MITLLLDIDGTLLSSKGAGFRSILKVMNHRYGVRKLPEVRVHGQTDKGIWSDLFQKLEIEIPDSISDLNEEYCHHLRQELTKSPGDILPGVVPFLESVSADSQFAVGLLTGNAERAARIKMECFGLVKYVSEFGGFGDHFVDRNHVAESALESAKLELGNRFNPNRVWVVGDTLNDIRCARHIQAKILAVGTGGTPYSDLMQNEPDALFQDMTPLDSILKTFSQSLGL